MPPRTIDPVITSGPVETSDKMYNIQAARQFWYDILEETKVQIGQCRSTQPLGRVGFIVQKGLERAPMEYHHVTVLAGEVNTD